MRFERLTLPQLMLLWGAMRADLDNVEVLVKEQVLQLKQTQVVHNIHATYGHGKGSYDHQAIAQGMEPGNDLVAKYVTVTTTTNWRAICEEIEKTLDPQGKGKLYELRDMHFTPGKEQVRISFEKQDKKKSKEGAET